MAVEERPQTYHVHGRTFDHREDAESFDAIMSARENYLEARQEFVRVLASSMTTADGEAFNMEGYGFGLPDYYQIRWDAYFPYVVRLTLWLRDIEVAETNSLVEFHFHERKADGRREWRLLPISEVYASAKKAEAECKRLRRIELERLLRDCVPDSSGRLHDH